VLNAHASKSVQVVASGSGTQTVNFALVKSEISKVSGKITDTDGNALAGIRVTLGNQNDTTGADGLYSFDSVRTGDYSMRVRDTVPGQTIYDTTVTFTTRGTADVTKDVQVRRQQSSVKGPQAIEAGSSLSISAGVVRLGSLSEAGSVKVYGADGRCVFVQRLRAGTSSLTLPAGVRETPGAYVVRVTQKAAVYCKQFVVR
jgi:hypothetical protein